VRESKPAAIRSTKLMPITGNDASRMTDSTLELASPVRWGSSNRLSDRGQVPASQASDLPILRARPWETHKKSLS
jgi:hypothetical protein